MALHVDFACCDYDLLRPLRDGSVRAEGIEINFIPISKPPEVHWRMAIHAEFDVAEMSLGSYVAGKSRGDLPLVGIPAFVYRKFRHSAAYINRDAGIERPADLRGKQVGVPEWQMTATIWLRGILQDEHGLALKHMHWLAGGLESAGRREKIPLNLPPEIKVDTIPAGKNLSAMLVAGEIDALISAQVPEPYSKRVPQVARLFPNSRETEADYFRRTGIFPIMHVVVLREELYRRRRWVAQSLFKALTEAKNACTESLRKNNGLLCALPWAGDYIEETSALMGADFSPYGIERNRKTLETFLRYCLEQGISQREMTSEELFASETLDTFRV